MSIWDFLAAVEGYRQANDPDKDKHLSGAEQDAIWEFVSGG